jgi:putative endonuclease
MNKVGNFGEDIACVFLKKHGYKIVERNYLKKWGELDIVAKKARKLCFVEVKTVSCEMFDESAGVASEVVTHVTVPRTGYRPEENMHSSKIKKFTRVIQTYLQEKGIDQTDWSAALIAVRVDTAKKIAKVRFIENLVLQ